MTVNEARMRQIVVDHLRVEPEKVTREANFIDDLGADSLDHIELIVAFEEAFNVEIGDSEVEAVKTFGDAVKLIDRLVLVRA